MADQNGQGGRKKGEEKSVGQGSVRLYTTWTMAKIDQAMRSAESGVLSQAVAVCEWLLTDDRLAGCLEARVDAVLGNTPTFEKDAPTKGRKSPALMIGDESEPDPIDPQMVRMIEDLANDFASGWPEAELKQLLTWTLLLGVAPARQQPMTDEATGRMVPVAEFWHPQTLVFDQYNRQWSISDSLGQKHIIHPGDGEWILHCLCKNRPWAYGLWRSLAKWALQKDHARGDLARHSEKAALHVATSEYDKDGNCSVTDPQREAVVRQVSSRGADAAIALVPGMALDLIETTTGPELYIAQIDEANDAIAIRIRGGNLSTSVTGGSHAAAESQADTSDGPKRKFDAASLSTTLHDQSFVWWSNWNYGTPQAPWVVWAPDAADVEINYNSFTMALQSLDAMGYSFDFETLRNQYRMTFLKGYDETRRAPAPSAGGFGGFGAFARGRPQAHAHDARASVVARGAQHAIDTLDADAASAGRKALAPDVNALLQVVDKATSFDEMQTMLVRCFEGLSQDDLQSLTEKALVLAELTGRAAVLAEL